MVQTISYRTMKNAEGKEFYALELQGALETVRSSQTGRMYVTSRRCLIPTTLNEEGCKLAVGQLLPGRIAKVETAPHPYTIPETGEVITLDYAWKYEEVEEEQEAVMLHAV